MRMLLLPVKGQWKIHELDEKNIEEYVRQWVLQELINTYSYPKEWLGERIVVEETVQMGTMKKEADISIKNERGKTYFIR